jgi:hypothetical protein
MSFSQNLITKLLQPSVKTQDTYSLVSFLKEANQNLVEAQKIVEKHGLDEDSYSYNYSQDEVVNVLNELPELIQNLNEMILKAEEKKQKLSNSEEFQATLENILN